MKERTVRCRRSWCSTQILIMPVRRKTRNTLLKSFDDTAYRKIGIYLSVYNKSFGDGYSTRFNLIGSAVLFSFLSF